MTVTSTREEVSLTRVEVRRPASGGRCEARVSSSGPPDRPLVRPMLLSSDDRGARVSLVPEGALLLAGDAVRVEVVVGPGAGLELVEPAGTVAYAMAGSSASWDVSIRLGAAASLVWAGEPFVVAEGAQVDRRTSVSLAWDSTLVLREVLVLGRHGERPGRIRQAFEAVGPNGVPVVVDSLSMGPDDGPLLLGARAMGTVTSLGVRLPDGLPGTRLELEAEGTLLRHLCDEAHLAVPPDVWHAARALAPLQREG